MESPECDLFRVLRKAKGMQLINGKEELFAKVSPCDLRLEKVYVSNVGSFSFLLVPKRVRLASIQDVFVLKTCFRKNITVEENIH